MVVVQINGNKLRQLRESRVLGVRDLAKASGVSHQTIYELEQGRHGAWPQTIHKLANALGVEPGELVKPDGDK